MTAFITNECFDAERALYHLQNAVVSDCRFAGPADGESALKEAHHFAVRNCAFDLRYPFWHCDDFSIENCAMSETCRAALWYSRNARIADSRLHGIKALRECEDIRIEDSDVISPEFGWRSRNLLFKNTSFQGEYFLLEAYNLKLENCRLNGKYSFQYVENMQIDSCNLDTKDAFWHTKNVTVRDSVVKGEYLGWYSENLTLIDCTIIGTQPLCYCKNLVLENCEMVDCDLAFEYSSVEATVKGYIDSVKNPLSGHIKAGSIGEIIREDAVYDCNCEIETEA